MKPHRLVLPGHSSEQFILSIFNFFNVYVFLRERERERGSGGEAEREGDTDSEAGSRLRAVGTELDTRLEPTNLEIMTGAKVGCLTDCATRVPLKNFFF